MSTYFLLSVMGQSPCNVQCVCAYEAQHPLQQCSASQCNVKARRISAATTFAPCMANREKIMYFPSHLEWMCLIWADMACFNQRSTTHKYTFKVHYNSKHIKQSHNKTTVDPFGLFHGHFVKRNKKPKSFSTKD